MHVISCVVVMAEWLKQFPQHWTHACDILGQWSGAAQPNFSIYFSTIQMTLHDKNYTNCALRPHFSYISDPHKYCTCFHVVSGPSIFRGTAITKLAGTALIICQLNSNSPPEINHVLHPIDGTVYGMQQHRHPVIYDVVEFSVSYIYDLTQCYSQRQM